MAWLLKRKRRLIASLAVATVVGASFCLSFSLGLFHITQLRSSDLLFRAAGINRNAAPDNTIVIVAIDDNSLEQLGKLSSWPRSHYARLIDAIKAGQARLVVFDVLFSGQAEGDEELVNSMKSAGNVILPVVDAQTMLDSAAAMPLQQPGNTIRPLAMLEEAVLTTGHANVRPDADGVVRRLSLAIPTAGKDEPALALASAAKYLRRPEVFESPFENHVLPFAGRSIPLVGDREMLINYMSNPRRNGEAITFETRSFVDVLNGEVAPELFQDKIVIIGAKASGLADYFWTPMGRRMSGVEIHASALHTILAGIFLRPAPGGVTAASILTLAFLCGLIVSGRRTLRATLFVALLCAAYFLAAFSFFDSGIMLNLFYPPLAVMGTFVGVNLYNVASEQYERREITRIFGRFVSPPVVDKILMASGEHEIKLGGEEYDVTTLFADVRNFSGISEGLPPQELLRILNIYLSMLINSVQECDGIVNKFGGDSIMAIWNVPVECAGHALLAVKAAVSAQRVIREWQEKEANLTRMEFGIGINTGRVVAGNTGSHDRLEYSVIGDAVNSAAKIAGAAPGGKVWIGSNTFDQVKDFITVKSLEPLKIKGKREPIRIYEVVDLSNNSLSEA